MPLTQFLCSSLTPIPRLSWLLCARAASCQSTVSSLEKRAIKARALEPHNSRRTWGRDRAVGNDRPAQHKVTHLTPLLRSTEGGTGSLFMKSPPDFTGESKAMTEDEVGVILTHFYNWMTFYSCI